MGNAFMKHNMVFPHISQLGKTLHIRLWGERGNTNWEMYVTTITYPCDGITTYNHGGVHTFDQSWGLPVIN